MATRLSEDPMDLGGFMKTFVLNNPFNNLSTLGAGVDEDEDEEEVVVGAVFPPSRRRGLALRVPSSPPPARPRPAERPADAKASPPRPAARCHPPGGVTAMATTPASLSSQGDQAPPLATSDSNDSSVVTMASEKEAGLVVIDTTGMVLDTPKGHVGSNVAFAASLKMARLSGPCGVHPQVQHWLYENFLYVPGYAGSLSVDWVYDKVQSVFLDMTRKKISMLIRMTFPDCQKCVTRNSTFYRGLVAKPEPEDYFNVELLKALGLVKGGQATLKAAAKRADAPLPSLAGMYYWHQGPDDPHPDDPHPETLTHREGVTHPEPVSHRAGLTESPDPPEETDTKDFPVPTRPRPPSGQTPTGDPGDRGDRGVKVRTSQGGHNLRRTIRPPAHLGLFYQRPGVFAGTEDEEVVTRPRSPPAELPHGAARRKTVAKRRLGRESAAPRHRQVRRRAEAGDSDASPCTASSGGSPVDSPAGDSGSVLRSLLLPTGGVHATPLKEQEQERQGEGEERDEKWCGGIPPPSSLVKEEPIDYSYGDILSNIESSASVTKRLLGEANGGANAGVTVTSRIAAAARLARDACKKLPEGPDVPQLQTARAGSPPASSGSCHCRPEVDRLRGELAAQVSANRRLEWQLAGANDENATLKRALRDKQVQVAALADDFSDLSNHFRRVAHRFKVIQNGLSDAMVATEPADRHMDNGIASE